MSDLQGGTPEDNARLIRDILSGTAGPPRDIVVLNAAAGLLVGGKVADLQSGIPLAQDSIDSGLALEVLDKLVAF